MKKNLFIRFKAGVIKGWNTPTLPENLLKLQLHPIILLFNLIFTIDLMR